ncbi:hypothetical protein H6G16_09880 [Cyanobium sp. FACHB-13342]|nr:glycosyltransferase [Cyanobium sp. FACHB-13342]MBD2423782.1 hypothetical protein [Cyanobium sp. FACHB-13342]
MEPILFLDESLKHLVEVIVGDDSDTPLLSADEVRSYRRYVHRFVYLHNRPSLGAVHNWNHLLLLAKGRYSWLCHHDEHLLNVQSSLPLLLHELQAGKGDIYILPLFKAWRHGRYWLLQRHTPCPILVLWILRYPSLFIRVNPVGPPSAVIHRSALSCLYDQSLKWLVDVEFYRRLLIHNSKNVVTLPSLFGIVSDQSYGETITESLRPALAQTKAHELSRILPDRPMHFRLLTTVCAGFVRVFLHVSTLIQFSIVRR